MISNGQEINKFVKKQHILQGCRWHAICIASWRCF